MPGPIAVLACLVIGVADGDTLTARCEFPGGVENIKVRLAEIDAPERGQAWGNRSRQGLSVLCIGKSALVEPVGSDRYGRTVARVRCDGIDANSTQIRAGLAWVYDQHASNWTLYALQSEAREARRGLWSDPAPQAPWHWRKQRRPEQAK